VHIVGGLAWSARRRLASPVRQVAVRPLLGAGSETLVEVVRVAIAAHADSAEPRSPELSTQRARASALPDLVEGVVHDGLDAQRVEAPTGLPEICSVILFRRGALYPVQVVRSSSSAPPDINADFCAGSTMPARGPEGNAKSAWPGGHGDNCGTLVRPGRRRPPGRATGRPQRLSAQQDARLGAGRSLRRHQHGHA